MSANRRASRERKTGETDIRIQIDIDGTGRSEIDTGIAFFDHMLTLLSRHSLVDLEIDAEGDLEVDFHHTVEDTGIVLGQCFAEAIGEKRGIHRYGWALLPMDETLARVAVDFSGRPFLDFRAPDGAEPVGGSFPFSLVEEFLRAFAFNAQINLHAEVLYGRDSHHMAEATFKGLARAVRQALSVDPRISNDIPSTKEVL